MVGFDTVKTGIVFGCFIPLHEGHLSLIEKSWEQNDRTILAVCGYAGDRGEGFLPFPERASLMRRLYGDHPRTCVVTVDDRKLGLTGTFSLEAWKTWSEELFANAGCCPHDERVQYQWYLGEDAYATKLMRLYPSHRFHVADRSAVPVSGTQIRENWRACREHIHPLFAEELERKGIR